MKKTSDFPPGWDEQRVRELLDYYENQTDEEAAVEHEAALSRPDYTLMEVPVELVSAFRHLIAEHEKQRAEHLREGSRR